MEKNLNMENKFEYLNIGNDNFFSHEASKLLTVSMCKKVHTAYSNTFDDVITNLLM